MSTRPRTELHAHTTESDGLLSPFDLVNLAVRKQLECLAITDHDTTAAYSGDLVQLAKASELVLIGGIEASARTPYDDVHLLGLGIAPGNATLLSLTNRVRDARVTRAKAILDKLRGLGVTLSWEAVAQHAGTVVTRPHIASALVDAGYTADLRASFDRYLAKGAPAHVSLREVTSIEWIEAIHAAGGLVFLAHPGDFTSHRTVRHLIEEGLDGFEVWHPSHDATLVEYYRNLADRHGLLVSGGSDFHGRSALEEERFGEYGPTRERWHRLKERLSEASFEPSR